MTPKRRIASTSLFFDLYYADTKFSFGPYWADNSHVPYYVQTWFSYGPYYADTNSSFVGRVDVSAGNLLMGRESRALARLGWEGRANPFRIDGDGGGRGPIHLAITRPSPLLIIIRYILFLHISFQCGIQSGLWKELHSAILRICHFVLHRQHLGLNLSPHQIYKFSTKMYAVQLST